jgi:hypothetical protein
VKAFYQSNDIAWWENLAGNGQEWEAYTVNSYINGAFCIKTADMDGDSNQDIISTARFDDEVSWCENTDGTGSLKNGDTTRWVNLNYRRSTGFLTTLSPHASRMNR